MGEQPDDRQPNSGFTELASWKRPAATAVVLASAPGMALMFAALGPALPLVATHYGGSMTAQLVMTMPGIGVVAGGAIGGFTIDQLGIRATLYLALLGGLSLSRRLRNPWRLPGRCRHTGSGSGGELAGE